MDLTDKQSAVLEPIFRPRRRPDGRGRPWTDPYAVLNAALWILRTGAPWGDLPRRYPPYQTCHRRFRLWQRSGRLDRLLQRSQATAASPASETYGSGDGYQALLACGAAKDAADDLAIVVADEANAAVRTSKIGHSPTCRSDDRRSER